MITSVRRACLLTAFCLGTALAGCSRSRDGAPSVVAQITSPAGPGSGEPFLASHGDKVYLSWLEPADSAHALRFAVLDDTTWSEPRTIRSGRDFFVNWADFPSLKVLGGGRLAA